MNTHPYFARAIAMLALCTGLIAHAETEQESWKFKLTPSFYSNSDQHSAWDVNLRGNYGSHTVWVGHYLQGADAQTTGFKQTRTGYENTLTMPFGALTPSIQSASGGFFGGSINAQVGSGDEYLILGFGRTLTLGYDYKKSVFQIGGGSQSQLL